MMRRLWQTSVVQGFEFQNLAEWDAAHPPRDEAARRLAAWEDSERHTVDEIAAWLRKTGLPILSVHANRDVGFCLCRGGLHDLRRGQQLIHQSLSLAEEVGAPVCVFHLWDTRMETFDPGLLHDALHEAAAQHPSVKAAVENIPTRLPGHTPFELVRQFEWITLDLQWAAMYDELDRFAIVEERIANVHLRGRLRGGEWLLDDAPFGFYEALDMIRNEWHHSSILTMEPSGLRQGDWDCLVAAMRSLGENRT